MITVRFPDGTSIQYNDAQMADWRDDGTVYLYRGRDANRALTGFVARVPRECVVEFQKACNVYNPVCDGDLQKAIQTVRTQMRDSKRWHDLKALGELKRELAAFDARRQNWK